MIERLKEILGILDADIYWKDCNFIEDTETEDMPTFYSRDYCRSMTFKELLIWYLPRLGSWQDEPKCDEYECRYGCKKCNDFLDMDQCEDHVLGMKIKERHYELFMELVDIYAFYKSDDCSRYNRLKNRLKSILEDAEPETEAEDGRIL